MNKKPFRYHCKVVARLLFLAWVGSALCLTGCGADRAAKVSSAPASNGAGYGGGDNPVIASARRQLVLALRYYQLGVDSSSFATYKDCSRILDQSVCFFMQNLSSNQRTLLRQLTDQVAPQVIAQNSVSPIIPIVLTSDRLRFLFPDGVLHDVAGLTETKAQGTIRINSDNAHLLSAPSLAQLIAHENLHATAINGKFMTDNDLFAGFESEDGPTRLAFDSWSAVVIGYLLDHAGLTPTFYPSSNDVCQHADLKDTLAAAPYYYHDAAADLATGGQKQSALSTALSSVDTGDFTLMIWTSLDSAVSAPSDTGRLLFSNIDYNNPFSSGLELYLKNGNLIADTDTYTAQDSGIALTPDVFHLVGITRTGGKVFTYVDGVPGKVYPASGAFAVGDPLTPGSVKSDASAWLGRADSHNVQDNFWQGRIGAVYFYPAAITDGQIATLYQCGIPRK